MAEAPVTSETDKLAIRALLERYADAVVRGDAADWRATWSEQGAEWHMPGGLYRGVDAIVERWRDRMAQFDRVMFRVSIGDIAVEGDTATVRSCTSETFCRAGEVLPEIRGRYDDVLARRDGRWRFVQRHFSRLGAGPPGTLLEGE